jgi:membrane-associated phospholipid phosphatase
VARSEETDVTALSGVVAIALSLTPNPEVEPAFQLPDAPLKPDSTHATPFSPSEPSPPSETQAGQTQFVYRISPVVDGLVIGISSLAIILPTAYGSQLVHPRCPCSPEEVNAFDRHVIGNNSAFAGTLSDVSQLLAIAAPIVFDAADVGFHREFVEDMVVYAEATSVSGAILTLTKYAVQRPRPYAYAAGTSAASLSSAAYTSFYSGHTAIAVTALTAGSMTLTLRHGPRVWPWLVTALVGTSIAVERVLAGQHFYSDVIFGAVAGAGVGVLVPLLHAQVGPVLSHVAVTPRPSGVQLSWAQAF